MVAIKDGLSNWTIKNDYSSLELAVCRKSIEIKILHGFDLRQSISKMFELSLYSDQMTQRCKTCPIVSLTGQLAFNKPPYKVTLPLEHPRVHLSPFRPKLISQDEFSVDSKLKL